MKYLLIDKDAEIKWDKVAKYGIDGLYFDIRESRLNVKFFDDILKHEGIEAVGVFAAFHKDAWPELYSDDGGTFAENISKRLEQIAPRTGKAKPKVQIDYEDHDMERAAECFVRWRQLRPTRDTTWTLEGGQGGLMDAEFVALIVSLGIRVVPQLYNGDMNEVWDSRYYVRDLTKRGFPEGLISPYYDAKYLPQPIGWDGFAFQQHRLP